MKHLIEGGQLKRQFNYANFKVFQKPKKGASVQEKQESPLAAIEPPKPITGEIVARCLEKRKANGEAVDPGFGPNKKREKRNNIKFVLPGGAAPPSS
jgi:hypothetical protein